MTSRPSQEEKLRIFSAGDAEYAHRAFIQEKRPSLPALRERRRGANMRRKTTGE